MNRLSVEGIAKMYDTKVEIIRQHLEEMEAKPIKIKQETNGLEHTLEVYDFEVIEEIGKRIFGRDISEDYELTEFNKLLKQGLDFNIDR